MKKVCILYGGAEGQLVGKKLRRELENAGFFITQNPYDADVALCHSAGIFQVPEDCNSPLVLAVGTPRSKGSNITSQVAKKLYLEARHPYKILPRLKKLGINIIYLFDIKQISKSIGGYKDQNYDCVKGNKVIVVASKQDPFIDCTSCLSISGSEDWSFIGLKGQHDDLWISPGPYIDVLKGVLGSR